MADVFSKEKRSQVMAAVRSKRNRSTELALASAFRKAGITGWRRHLALPGRPDFAFPRAKVAVFVDGCFWHGCKEHLRMPKSNQDYWRRKISRNQERDKAVTAALRQKGWTVLRVWGHELMDQEQVLRRIRRRILAGIANAAPSA